MLVVKIEIWPFGNKHKARTLGEMHIVNDGTGTGERGNYRADILPPEWHSYFPDENLHIEVRDWPRTEKSAWYLLKEILVRGLR